VCEATIDRAAAVALQERADRQVQIFSFNLYDEHRPFTFRIPLDALARASADSLRRDFAEPGRRWAAYVAGCLFMLHEQKLIDLLVEKQGLNLAILSTVPMGAGVASSAALEVATMVNLADHFGIRAAMEPLQLAALCQAAENRIVGAPCGIMDQVSCCLGEAGTLLRLVCQPHEPQPSLHLPAGIRVVGINSDVRHSVGGSAYARTRCAAFMAHRMILEKMREMATASAMELKVDPMRGYLANLDPRDYKQFFRPFLPETIQGADFLEKYSATIDTATVVDPDTEYPVQHAADHHVLEAVRVRRFVDFLESANRHALGSRPRMQQLDKAGHLMYASHLSYANDALLGAPECDLLVDMVRQREAEGFYGAKITGGGSGGTVAVLANEGQRTDDALAQIMSEYQTRTGRKPELFSGSSPGAWSQGTHLHQPAKT
jgi:L-arabinokinase